MIKNDIKITVSHLSRNAYIYIRQSTEHQVRENIESQERQYELFDLALQYQWKEESILIIDDEESIRESLEALLSFLGQITGRGSDQVEERD